MAIVIKWSDEAIKTFDNNIDYLIKEWSEKEISKNSFKYSSIFINQIIPGFHIINISF